MIVSSLYGGNSTQAVVAQEKKLAKLSGMLYFEHKWNGKYCKLSAFKKIIVDERWIFALNTANILVKINTWNFVF